MPRRIPEGRFQKLISAATEEFIARGYRRTQMEDVAKRLGVAKGTIYGYVQGKEALFDAALRYCDRFEAFPETRNLPLPRPKPGATVRYLIDRINEQSSQMLLARAVAGAAARKNTDLGEVCRDLYQRIHAHRFSIKLIDRCAVDRPELAKAWFGRGRWAQHALLVRFLEQEIARGRLRPIPDIALAARLVLETIVFWALHRHWDPSPQRLDEEHVEEMVVDLLLHGFSNGGVT